MAMAETPSATASKPRRTFHIQLGSDSPAEINFKQLVVQSSQPSSSSASAHSSPTAASISSKTPSTSRPQRFNIIEHLEKRYGGGSVLNDGNEDAATTRDEGRRDDDDLYDSEDSFIDDEELQQNIEDVRGQTRVKTKHSGFFVNAGEEIETLEKEEEEVQRVKTKKGNKRAVDGALRSFLDKLPDAASDWQPDEEVVTKLEILRTAVQELAETTPIPKVFPRSLDEPLRAVDKLVVEAHPNKWRVTGYFATLMTFLPYTKQYLKSNMLRLEARDVAKNEKEKLDNALDALTQLITAAYGTRAAAEPVEVVKADIAKDKEIGTKLHALLQLQDNWVLIENDYRQMLKTEDKKHMKEPDYKPLNQRQERNRMFNRILALFPVGLTDLQTLRALNKAAKIKTRNKPAQPKTPVKGTATAAKKKAADPTAGGGAAPVKRSIKPFKSRMMDDTPPFVEADFEDVEH